MARSKKGVAEAQPEKADRKPRSPAMVRLIGLAKLMACLGFYALLAINLSFGIWTAFFFVYEVWKSLLEIGTGQVFADISEQTTIGVLLIVIAVLLVLVIWFFVSMGL